MKNLYIFNTMLYLLFYENMGNRNEWYTCN